MRILKNKRGMTLVEVIVAIAILGIISVTFLSALSSYYFMMLRTKGITENVFVLQEDMEEEIVAIKQKIKNNQTVSQSQQSYTLFSGLSNQVSVQGYQVTKTLDGKTLNTVVSNSTPISLPVPVISSVSITKSNPARNYAADSTLSLTGQYTYSDSTDLFFTKFQWYVSRDGYNMPTYSNPQEIEVGVRYPRFPDDYEPIVGATTTALNNLSDYAGHHLVFTATPVASSMKLGLMKNSEPLFLYGPPVIDNLRYHLDASVVDKNNTAYTRFYDDGSTNGRYYLHTWQNMVAYLVSSPIANAVQLDTSKQPLVNEESFTELVIPEVWGRVVTNSASGTKMSVANYATSTTDPTAITFYLVAKMSPSMNNTPILQGTNWSLGIVNTETLGLTKGSTVIQLPTGSIGSGLDDQWHVYTGVLSSSDFSIQIDKDLYLPLTPSSGSPSTRSLTINAQDIEIAELLVYHTNLSSANRNLVLEYLLGKYDPTIIPWTIDYMQDISEECLQGATYVPPTRALATMTNTTTRYVDINWHGTINTSTVGTQTVSGSAAVDSTKSVTLRVNVVGLTSVSNIEQTVRYGSVYTRPLVVDATYSDGSVRQVPVTWAGTINTGIAGTQVVNGAIDYYPYTPVTLTVHVLRTPVQSITLSQSAASLYLAETLQLSATVSPANADDLTLTWNSNNVGVASVSSTGLVTANGVGQAIITVTSNDTPTLKAQCVVTVGLHYASLSNLTVENDTNGNANGGWSLITLSPLFSTDTTSYSINTYYNRIRFNFTRPSADTTVSVRKGETGSFTVVGGGTQYADNDIGSATITYYIRVSRPGYTQRDYSITVNKCAYLDDIYVENDTNGSSSGGWSSISLSPSFSSDTTSCSVNTFYNGIRFTFDRPSTDTTVSVRKGETGSFTVVGGTQYADNDIGSATITYYIRVSRPGYTQRDYSITVNRYAYAYLTNLSVEYTYSYNNELNELFSYDHLVYTATIEDNKVDIRPTGAAASSITINGIRVYSGDYQRFINLSPGNNVFTIVVRQTGKTDQTYTLTVFSDP